MSWAIETIQNTYRSERKTEGMGGIFIEGRPRHLLRSYLDSVDDGGCRSQILVENQETFRAVAVVMTGRKRVSLRKIRLSIISVSVMRIRKISEKSPWSAPNLNQSCLNPQLLAAEVTVLLEVFRKRSHRLSLLFQRLSGPARLLVRLLKSWWSGKKTRLWQTRLEVTISEKKIPHTFLPSESDSVLWFRWFWMWIWIGDDGGVSVFFFWFITSPEAPGRMCPCDFASFSNSAFAIAFFQSNSSRVTSSSSLIL